MKTIKVQNKKVKKILEKKNAIVDEGKELYREFEAIQKKLEKTGLQIQKHKDALIPFINQYRKEFLIEGKMNWHDDLVSVELDDDEVVFKLVDAIEEFTVELKKQYEQSFGEPNDEQTDAKE